MRENMITSCINFPGHFPSVELRGESRMTLLEWLGITTRKKRLNNLRIVEIWPIAENICQLPAFLNGCLDSRHGGVCLTDSRCRVAQPILFHRMTVNWAETDVQRQIESIIARQFI